MNKTIEQLDITEHSSLDASLPTQPEIPIEKPGLSIIMIEGVEFITDGKYQCPVKKGPYSLKPFKNPSGNYVVNLNGNRPNPTRNESDTETSVDHSGSEILEKRSLRCRENIDTLKKADAKRSLLIREDQNSEKTFHTILTTLTQEEVKDAEQAKFLMVKLPAPDWNTNTWTFQAIVNFIADNFKPCRNPKPLTEAVDEFNKQEEESNLRYATTDGKASHLKRLITTCEPGIMVHEVPVETIKELIHRGDTKKTWKKNRSNLNTFFTWAADPDRGYVSNNPVKLITLRKKTDDYKVPVILPNHVVVDILSKAQTFKGGRLFLYCVVGIVVALRPAELARIQVLRKVLGIDSFKFGDDEDEQFVDVIGKTRRMRNSIIPPEFVRLIKVYVEAGYPVIPRNFAADWTLLRSMVGFLGRRDLLPSYLTSEGLEIWTRDVLRHVGITHHLNRSQDEHKTAIWAGDSPRMIYSNYKGKATRKQTREFYAIAAKLKLPTVEDLKADGVPEGATDSELKRLKCPVDRPNTVFLSKKDFDIARKAFLKRCPEAAIPEVKGRRRTGDNWSKRRNLILPKTQDELIRLVWTNKIVDLAREYKVASSTFILALHEAGLPADLFPRRGDWQKRAVGKIIDIPDEVKKVFPEGLPAYSAPVGRQISCERPPIHRFFAMVWEMQSKDISLKLKWSASTVEREIKRLKLPRPNPKYWLTKPGKRVIPHEIGVLLKLNANELESELAKGLILGGVYYGIPAKPGELKKME